VCGGDGELVDKRQAECRACQGTGKAAGAAKSSAQGLGFGNIIGKIRGEEPTEERPPQASSEPEADEEMGGSAPSRPAAKAKARTKEKQVKEKTLQNSRSTADAARDAASEGACMCGMAFCGIKGKGIHWRDGEGLEIDITLTIRCLMTTFGSLLTFIGFILMAQKAILFYILGGVILVAGVSFNLYANYAACLRCLQSAAVSGARV
jgi:hypothetical protein